MMRSNFSLLAIFPFFRKQGGFGPVGAAEAVLVGQDEGVAVGGQLRRDNLEAGVGHNHAGGALRGPHVQLVAPRAEHHLGASGVPLAATNRRCLQGSGSLSNRASESV